MYRARLIIDVLDLQRKRDVRNDTWMYMVSTGPQYISQKDIC